MSEEAVPPKGVDKSKPRSDDSKLKRSASRLAAVQALYQMELSGQPMIKVRDQFEAHRLGRKLTVINIAMPISSSFAAC